MAISVYCLTLFMFSHFAMNPVVSSKNYNESKRSKRSDDAGPLEAVVLQQAQEIAALKASFSALPPSGSTYVRWGRQQCPTGATIIYSGFAAGGSSGASGTGANRLCMVKNPVMDTTPIRSEGHGTITGGQYYFTGYTSTDVLCSLCHTPYSTTFMVPGTNRCPDGTTEQYHGYLSSGNYAVTAQSEYLCLDANPEERPGTTANEDCAWFEHTAIVCGSLPCPPYVAGKAATCAVCSK